MAGGEQAGRRAGRRRAGSRKIAGRRTRRRREQLKEENDGGDDEGGQASVTLIFFGHPPNSLFSHQQLIVFLFISVRFRAKLVVRSMADRVSLLLSIGSRDVN